MIEKRLYNATKPIEFVKAAAGYLIEDAQAKLEKQRLDPLGASETNFNRAVALHTAEAYRAISETNSYLANNRVLIEERIRFTIGKSPDIVSDIIKGIAKPVKDIIETALDPIDAAITAAVTSIKVANNFIESRVNAVTSAAKTVVTTAISATQGVLETAIAGVKTAVEGLLDGVAALVDPLITALQSAVGALISKLTSLFTFDVEDIFKLQTDLQDMGMAKMASQVKKTASGG